MNFDAGFVCIICLCWRQIFLWLRYFFRTFFMSTDSQWHRWNTKRNFYTAVIQEVWRRFLLLLLL